MVLHARHLQRQILELGDSTLLELICGDRRNSDRDLKQTFLALTRCYDDFIQRGDRVLSRCCSDERRTRDDSGPSKTTAKTSNGASIHMNYRFGGFDSVFLLDDQPTVNNAKEKYIAYDLLKG